MPETFLHGVEIVELDTGPRPIRTARSSVIGIVGTAPGAAAEDFPPHEPVLITGSRTHAAKLGTKGSLPAAVDGILDQIGALIVVIVVPEGATEAETLANVAGGVNEATGALGGLHALIGAESALGVVPRIICAPGFTHQRPEGAANPVVAEAKGLLDRLGAILVADGPGTTDAAAIELAADAGDPAIYLVDPWVRVQAADGSIVSVPSSGHVAGVIARTDNDSGFWHSPSNRPVSGIVGISRPIDFRLGDANTRANVLNEGKVATIVRSDGFRLWGNRGTGGDEKWAFLSVRRTATILNLSVQAAHQWAVDRNITRTYLEDVAESVNAYIAGLVGQGAILGGRCWADPDLNTPAAIASGKVYFNLEFTPPFPAEHITFRSSLVQTYIAEALG